MECAFAVVGGVRVGVAVLPGRLVWSNGYFIQSAVARTLASGVPADAVDYPTARNTLQAFTSELSWSYDEILTFTYQPAEAA